VSFERSDIRQAAEFRSAMREFIARSDRAMRSSHLTPRRYQLLLAILAADDEAITISSVAEQLHLAQSTASELVDRTEAAGLVIRSADADDGRLVVVRATAEGRRRFERSFSIIRDERRDFVAWCRAFPDQTRARLPD
jgi:DNA-binding MarR family transcriptional regulator